MSDKASRIPVRHMASPRSSRIAVQVEKDEEDSVFGNEHANDTLNNTSQMEHQMDMEVEKVLKEWDSNIQKRTQDTFSLKPMTSSSLRPRSVTEVHTVPKSGNMEENLQRRVFDFSDNDIAQHHHHHHHRPDLSYDSSTDTVEDDPRTPLYILDPHSGEKVFHMEFDIDGYDEKNISIKVSGSRLVVHAIQNHDGMGKRSSTEFCRKIKIPKDVDKRFLQCRFDHHTRLLIVEAPLNHPTPKPQLNTSQLLNSTHLSQSSLNPVYSRPNSVISRAPPDVLNQPVIQTEPNGSRSLNLVVEVGRVFKSGDVVVKVRGQNKVVISAERDESNLSSKLNATLSREFDLSYKVDPHTLKAGLTTDGLLRITAIVLEDCITENKPNELIHVT